MRWAALATVVLVDGVRERAQAVTDPQLAPHAQRVSDAVARYLPLREQFGAELDAGSPSTHRRPPPRRWSNWAR